jgi:response regulator RpfG family c-di-GMP phosphodiesterase
MARLSKSDGLDERQLFGGQQDDFTSDASADESLTAVLGADYPALPPAGREYLERLLRIQLLGPATTKQFLDQADVSQLDTLESTGEALIKAGLMTHYQLERIQAGTTHGLVLGNYKVLDRLGAGCMGVVFLAEHYLMKRRVAVKVLPVDDDCESALLDRFYSEILVLADLHHPNIVMAYDAGELLPTNPRTPPLLYLVMELVDGGDLEQRLMNRGLPSIPDACDWIRQAACGLQEAHDHHLIHRDIKPSNLLLSEHGQVKLVDFGLVRQFSSRMTTPRVLLGSVEFMAPEQSRDPTGVGGQADIYGLGATLFWLLTGELPHPRAKSVASALLALQNEKPRRVRALRPDVPPELDDLVDQMLNIDPRRRPAMPVNIMNAMMPFSFAPSKSLEFELEIPPRGLAGSANESPTPAPLLGQGRRVLVVDDETAVRQMACFTLEQLGCQCEGAESAAQGLEILKQRPCEVVLLELKLPDRDGYEVCQEMRKHPFPTNLRIIIVSGVTDKAELSEALIRGADDYLSKPFAPRELWAKVRHALQQKDALDQYEKLNRNLRSTNYQLEHSLEARSEDIRQAQDALLFAMAKMAESRDGETPGHFRRLQDYVQCLGEHVAQEGSWSGVIDDAFLDQVRRCVPLHDIGKIALPESILRKPGPLEPAERAQMEKHTLLGAEILEAIGRNYGGSMAFLSTALAIVRHHHERFDGQGYPDRLAGESIPQGARLVAVADVYDALRRQRCHKPPFTHQETVHQMLEGSPGQFDPILMRAFSGRESEFDRIFQSTRD